MQRKLRLTRQFQFRMTEQEYRDLETASEDTGLSPSLIARLSLKRSLKEGIFVPGPVSPRVGEGVSDGS